MAKFEENRDVDIVRSIFGYLRKKLSWYKISNVIMAVHKKYCLPNL